MSWNRRRVLAAGTLGGAAAAAGWLTPAFGRDPGADGPRRISLANLHTGERIDVEYSRDGAYLSTALGSIENVLRDFRTGERHAIDPRLMDYLTDVAQSMGEKPVFSVISGYRSPQTNARLRENGHGVAQHSLHMQGRAIDVRLAGTDCASVAEHALSLKRGGVGYYRASDFVHLDTGAFRTWKG